jgi:O-acetyl-ADP-ribose deacetylase (regulator of RNase III)
MNKEINANGIGSDTIDVAPPDVMPPKQTTSSSTNIQLSSSWFANRDLYEQCTGPTVIVNNSNSKLSFGGGGTNGAIRKFFFPEHDKCCCGMVKRGRQNQSLWIKLAGGLVLAPAQDFEEQEESTKEQEESTTHEAVQSPGSVWYTPLPAEKRNGTHVTHIVHVVGPKNDIAFANGRTEDQTREHAAAIVEDATLRCLHLADEVNASTIVMSGISSGIFAGRDKKWRAAMYNAMNSSFDKYKGTLNVVLVGQGWKKD